MKRKVTITLEVDPLDYNEGQDTDADALDIVKDFLSGGGDPIPGKIEISCGELKETLEFD